MVVLKNIRGSVMYGCIRQIIGHPGLKTGREFIARGVIKHHRVYNHSQPSLNNISIPNW